jgi:DNA replication and repair protein RecF
MTASASALDSGLDDTPNPPGPAVRRLTVSKFRNYGMLKLDLDRAPVVLTGPNGAGKTNLLEAVSFLAPGRGLRRARLGDIDRMVDDSTIALRAGEPLAGEIRAGEIQSGETQPEAAGFDDNRGAWAVSAEIEGAFGRTMIGTGRDPMASDTGGDKRLVRVDGAPAKSQTLLGEYLAISWLTPQMDRLFTEGSSQRRRFLDRLVYAFDSRHAGRVSGYTHALRERGRLLRQGRTDTAWHVALEEQIATSGVAVAAARRELIGRLAPLASAAFGPFPGALMSVEGEVESWLDDGPALDAEDRFRAALVKARRVATGEVASVPGPHRGDFKVRHSIKNMPAEQCSTGEQKALLIAIVLAHARLRTRELGGAPLLLLDEVAAHLDSERRAALYDIISSLGSQAWLTGTDATLFDAIADRAQHFTVRDGALTQH